ncbi:MAG TPA: hypothetical protein VH442_18915, partial [Micromonosporaceae bacterium]
FWLWAGLYSTTPFLVLAAWLRNRRLDRQVSAEDLLLPAGATWALALVGAAAVVTGAVLYLWPAAAMRFWPWSLTPLTARTLGAVLCLGVAGLGAPIDRRWTVARIPLQAAFVMLVLMFVAGLRAHAQFDAGNALTWVFLVGFIAVIVAIAVLSWRMDQRAWRMDQQVPR